MRAVTWLLRVLAAEGVRHVFLAPGAGGAALAAEAAAAGLVPIVAAGAAGAAVMADGYARASGRFGVCLAGNGPGVAGLVAAAAAARADASPVLFVTDAQGDAAWPDPADATALLRAATAASVAVTAPDRLASRLRAGLTRLLAGPKAPVHLQLPFAAPAPEGGPAWVPLDAAVYAPRFVDGRAVERLWRILVPEGGGPAPTRLAVLAGAGVEKSGAATQLLAFAELFEIPVATTLRAKGAFPEDHRLSLGVLEAARPGLAGRVLSDEALEVLVVLGCSFAEAEGPSMAARLRPGRVLAQVDVDASVPGRDVFADVPVVGDCREALALMMEGGSARINRFRSGNQARAAWLREKRAKGSAGDAGEAGQGRDLAHGPAASPGPVQGREPDLAFVAEALRRALPRRGCLAVDGGPPREVAARRFAAFEPRTFFTAMGAPLAGWALAAAAGVKAALPDRPVACLTDADGLLGYGLEVATAVRHGLGIAYVVAHGPGRDDARLPAARAAVDFAALARAMGARGLVAQRPQDVAPALAEALSGPGPCLVDVRCR
ncbi:MAG: thiamine pyrophosphate-binding protein [Solidesulfovibrio sp. DCME]|uniref:thiamine pyrophosphate-binding protein n=1 Tax=Solidesulfovibrio sp. DCME TaxID=3447380 RepID=UPI003D12135F